MHTNVQCDKLIGTTGKSLFYSLLNQIARHSNTYLHKIELIKNKLYFQKDNWILPIKLNMQCSGHVTTV